jgi:hypothetical protein
LNSGAVILSLVDEKGYTLRCTVTASGTIAGVKHVRTYTQDLTVLKTAGVSTIVAASAQVSQGTAGSVSWTLTFSVGVGPDRIKAQFTTGVTTAVVNVESRVDLTEVKF